MSTGSQVINELQNALESLERSKARNLKLLELKTQWTLEHSGPSSSRPSAQSKRRPGRRRRAELPARLRDPLVDEMINKYIPKNYKLECKKTMKRILELDCKRVALQMPEGLLCFGTRLIDIFKRFTDVLDVVVLADVTYGACCVDDYSAKAMRCDLLVHYGHSCLISVNETNSEDFKTMYVFVHIVIDVDFLCQTLLLEFKNRVEKLTLLGTVQFTPSLPKVAERLAKHGIACDVSRCAPLSRGEVLGCTSPCDLCGVVVFVADGRFHLESSMIANRSCEFLRYDPYSKKLTIETYDFETMHSRRRSAVDRASKGTKFILVLGTLGRQGSGTVASRLIALLNANNKQHVLMLASELSVERVKRASKEVDVWIQIACPRLSIDWGDAFDKPLLNSYEAFCALGATEFSKNSYPQDYYSSKGGPWTNYH